MRELDLSTRIYRQYNSDAIRYPKHYEIMDESIESNRCNEDIVAQRVTHETTGRQLLHHPLSSSHQIDPQMFHQMRSYFTPPAMSADSPHASHSQPTHYFWPAIVANSQFHPSKSISPVSEASSSSCSALLITQRKAKRKAIPMPNESKDEAYWERRKKNNESAKRSREIRRIKEQQTGTRVMFLEQENLKLRAEVETLREEIGKLRELFFRNRRRGDDIDIDQ